MSGSTCGGSIIFCSFPAIVAHDSRIASDTTCQESEWPWPSYNLCGT